MGALAVVGLAAALRAGVRAALAPAGQRLDRWRRVWFHPERELGQLVASLLIIAFLDAFAELYAIPAWIALGVFGLWALHLPADAGNWLRSRRRGTLELHERGFRLLDLGPLWLRALIALLAWGSHLLSPPLRSGLKSSMYYFISNIQEWLR